MFSALKYVFSLVKLFGRVLWNESGGIRCIFVTENDFFREKRYSCSIFLTSKTVGRLLNFFSPTFSKLYYNVSLTAS